MPRWFIMLFGSDEAKVKIETERAKENARQFLASNPTDEEVMKYWASAHNYSNFGSQHEQAYDRAYIEVLRPKWKEAKRREKNQRSGEVEDVAA